MSVQRQLEELERVAGELAVRVCYEPMAGLVQGTGGLCKVRGEYRVIIDRRLRAPERVNILADALRRFDLRHVELGDALRRMIGGGAVRDDARAAAHDAAALAEAHDAALAETHDDDAALAEAHDDAAVLADARRGDGSRSAE